MDLMCVTRNLGRWTSGQQWVDELAGAGRPDLMFLQETPAPGGLRAPSGYAAFPVDASELRNRGHCRSVTLVADALVAHVGPVSYVLPDILGDYVSEMVVMLPGKAPLHLFNVHASPRPVEDSSGFLNWKRDAEKYVYHSDVVTSVLAARAGSGADVLAVGDFNEAWLWDERYKTTTSHEFFNRLDSCGLADATMAHWGTEVTTQVKHPYQVDRLFATKGVELLVDRPSTSIGPDDLRSDHLPISFTLRR